MKNSVFRTFVGCVLLLLCCAAGDCAGSCVDHADGKPYSPTIADPILEPWRWHEEEVLRGLGVVCMAEADDGTLWFGNGGITRYDGVTVSHIPIDDALLSRITHHKKNPWAKAITILPDGSPLVLIGESLVHRSGDEWNVIIDDTGRSVFVAMLEQAEDGSIWLLVPDAVWRINADLSEASRVMTAPKGGFFGSFCFDPDGRLWVVEKTDALHAQLVLVPSIEKAVDQDAAGHEYPVPFETDATQIWVTAGKDGRLWYADDSLGTALAIFDPEKNAWSMCEGAPELRYFSLSTGKDGTIWVGGEKLIFRVSPTGKPTLYTGQQIPLPQVPLSMFETDDNRLWVIGRIGYVHSVDIGFSQWTTYEQLHFQCETSGGTQWFRSKKRDVVVSHDPATRVWTQYDESDGLIDRVLAITASSHGLIWATGSHKNRAALTVFDGTNWQRIRHPEFASWIEPKAVMEAADGTMWFGAGGPKIKRKGGALQYRVDDERKVSLIRHQQASDFPYYVTSIAQAPDRTIWLGSTFVYRYDIFTRAAIPDRYLRGLNTVDIVFDHDGTRWIAKEHAGVYQLDGDSRKLFSTPEGLAGVNLSDLLVLKDGTLLASSGEGISRYDGNAWTTHAYPNWWSMSGRNSSMHQSEDGAVWFNIDDNVVQPAQLIVNQTEPFRSIRYQAETKPPDTRISSYLKQVAQPGNSHIEWSAHDPWTSTPREDLQYSWRLDDGAWSEFSHETDRTFLKLNSGAHVLEVRARDRAFNLDPTPDRVEFSVIPQIWKRAWFIALIASFSAMIVVFVWMYIRTRERHLLEQQWEREKHLKEMDQLKTSFFTNISHELRTPVTLISGPLERLLEMEKDENKRSMLSMSLRNATRVWNLATQLLDFRKLEEGKLEVTLVFGKIAPYVSETVELFRSTSETNKVTCRMDCDEELEGYFDPEMLKKIVQNLVGNAIKFTASGGSVSVTLGGENVNEQQVLRLVVEDTGPGIAPEYLARVFERFYRIPEKSIVDGSGIGLNLTKELVDLLGGSIEAESPIHDDANRPGTRFTVLLPLDRIESVDHESNEVQDAE